MKKPSPHKSPYKESGIKGPCYKGKKKKYGNDSTTRAAYRANYHAPRS